jgi:hypothetical protein
MSELLNQFADAVLPFLPPESELRRQITPADGGVNSGEQSCGNIASHAQGAKATAEQVSPAISLPISPSTVENITTETDGNKRSNQSGTGNGKPNCYECKHRRGLSYSAHSECRHPVLDGKGRVLAVACVVSSGQFAPFNLIGNSHGIRNGWFTWPLDYDPVWLEKCDAFEKEVS